MQGCDGGIHFRSNALGKEAGAVWQLLVKGAPPCTCQLLLPVEQVSYLVLLASCSHAKLVSQHSVNQPRSHMFQERVNLVAPSLVVLHQPSLQLHNPPLQCPALHVPPVLCAGHVLSADPVRKSFLHLGG